MRARPAEAEQRRFAKEDNRAFGFLSELEEAHLKPCQGGVVEAEAISESLHDAQQRDETAEDDY